MFVVVLTGHCQEAVRRRARAADLDARLAEPLDLAALDRLLAARGDETKPRPGLRT